jgi:hypothetical protein
MNAKSALIALKKGYKIKDRSSNNVYLYMKDGLTYVANDHRHVGYSNLIIDDDLNIDWEILPIGFVPKATFKITS